MKTQISIQELTKMALLTALMAVSSYIIIPIPFSPVHLSAQTLMVNLIALLLPPRQAAYTILSYLLLGLIGLPIFAGGAAGPGVLIGPGGGYLVSWLPAVVLISLLKGKTYSLVRYSFVTIFAGMSIIYIFGSLYMKYVTGMTWSATLAAAVLPFIPLDTVKCIASAMIAKPIQVSLSRINYGNPRQQP